MADQTQTFDFTDGTSGKIRKTGIAYQPYTGWANCDVFNRPPKVSYEERAFMQFDTRPLPNDATVTKVEFKPYDAALQPTNNINSFTVYIGNIIGSTLDGDADEWTDGYDTYSGDLVSNVWIDLAQGGKDPTPYVSLTGMTDIRINGDFGGILSEGRSFNQTRDKCQLKITYHVKGIYNATIFNATINNGG